MVGNNCEFIKYVKENNFPMVTKLLASGANVRMCDDAALIQSVLNGSLSMVTKLLENGANVHARNDAVLSHSAANGYLAIVCKLLENGANVHACDDDALRFSIENGHLLVVEKLLEYGSDLHCDNKSILVNLKNNFSANLANVILPYCNQDDYSYFPTEYIIANVTPKKSANNIAKNNS